MDNNNRKAYKIKFKTAKLNMQPLNVKIIFEFLDEQKKLREQVNKLIDELITTRGIKQTLNGNNNIQVSGNYINIIKLSDAIELDHAKTERRGE